MPAPTKAQIKTFLEAALVSGTNPGSPRIPGQRQAFLRPGANGTFIAGVVPDAMDDFIDALAEGIQNFWIVWQAQQTVVGAETIAPFAPIAGTLP